MPRAGPLGEAHPLCSLPHGYPLRQPSPGGDPTRPWSDQLWAHSGLLSPSPRGHPRLSTQATVAPLQGWGRVLRTGMFVKGGCAGPMGGLGGERALGGGRRAVADAPSVWQACAGGGSQSTKRGGPGGRVVFRDNGSKGPSVCPSGPGRAGRTGPGRGSGQRWGPAGSWALGGAWL